MGTWKLLFINIKFIRKNIIDVIVKFILDFFINMLINFGK